MTTTLVLILLLCALALVHAGLLDQFSAGLRSCASADTPAVLDDRTMLSVIVPCRDERAHIASILQDLHAQDLSRDRYEVIVVDDGSTDGGMDIVEAMRTKWPALRSVRLSDNKGKKAAIRQGVQLARGEVVLVSDADVGHGPRHLRRVLDRFSGPAVDLLLMPVWTDAKGGWCRSSQEIEQAALLGVAIGSACSGRPLLANGANLAFRRSVYLGLPKEASGPDWASGDDMFLMAAMVAGRHSVTALAHPDVLVHTPAVEGWSAYFAQRLRWAGKMRAVRLPATLWIGGLEVLLPWALIAVTAWAVAHVALGQGWVRTWSMITLAWALWSLPILTLVHTVRRAFGSRERPLATLLALLQFVALAPLIALLAIFVRPAWKGRRT
ncbi:MAG: glycosyltransferase [Flavobacteriales bacterium]|nr:glycosyltransferase [Flavobacteriales bacterium]MCB9192910.1 glycosyltransferase [Flavobacteriales bacterium]